MKNCFKFYLCLMLMALNTPVLLAQTDALVITPYGHVNVVSGNLNVEKGKVQEGGNDLLPKGSIILWYGTEANVPKGWAICNGRNETPDLREKFVVGAGGQYKDGSTGGNATVALTENNLPAHSHTMESAGEHNHIYYQRSPFDKDKGTPDYIITGQQSGSGGLGIMNDPYDRTTNPNGAHTHTIKSTGGGQAFDNRPPFYALYYIMKL